MLERVQRRRVTPTDSSVEIALLDWGGDGPPALLHHANGFCAAVWEPVARSLSRYFRVISMDARGHGDSSKPATGGEHYRWEHFGADAAGVARAIVSELGVERIALGLGHSFGGTALMSAAAKSPGLFERLVLVDPVILPTLEGLLADPPPARGGALAEGARKRRVVWPSRAAARERWEGKELFSGWAREPFELYLAEALADRDDGQVELKCTGAVEAAIFECSGGFDAWGVAVEVREPVLIQRAVRGHFPREFLDELVASMHDARIVEADAGHLIPMERPDLVIDAVLEFAVDRAGRQLSTG